MKYLVTLLLFYFFNATIYGDTTNLILGGHMYGLGGKDTVTGFPSQSFIQGIDKFSTLNADGYIAGGDITCSGKPEQWDNLYSVFSEKWNFPFIAVMGNHDLENMDEWKKRVGDTYRSLKIGSTYIILLHSVEYPNNALSDQQRTWFENQLLIATNDASIKDILIAQHHLFWTKSIPRYEKIYKLGNAWYCEYKNQGYDVNNFIEDTWPKIVNLASIKPVTFFCGDAGFTVGKPSLFYDTLDNVTLLSCGYDAYGRKDNDAVILYSSINGIVNYECISPYDTVFEAIESYGTEYWNNYFKESESVVNDYDTTIIEDKFCTIPAGNFEMGIHINPRNMNYSKTTGHNITISEFVLSKTEVTVSEYLNFLNFSAVTKTNQYKGYSCIDLNDPSCQITINGGEYISKSDSYLNLPIVEVSWYGAIAYCNYLSELEGLSKCYDGDLWIKDNNGYRLPTEAEFEFAQRGGEGYIGSKEEYFRFYWSDNSNDHVHNHANYYGTGGRDEWDSLAPIASFPPNQFGIYDITGNAFEWVFDKFKPHSTMVGTEVNPVNDKLYDQFSATKDTIRTIRGGGYNFHWSACTNNYRSGEVAKNSNSYIGFRVAKGVPEDNSIEIINNIAISDLKISQNNIIVNFKSNSIKNFNISILDLKGRNISTIFHTKKINSKQVIVPFNSRNFAKGIYILSVNINKFKYTKKIIVR